MSPIIDTVFADGENLAANASSAGPSPVFPHVDNLGLVFHIDLLILAFFGFFALLTLPRFFTRLSRASEWRAGLFLYAAALPSRLKPSKRMYDISVPLETVANRHGNPLSDDSHTLHSHSHLIRRGTAKRITLDLPPHAKSWVGRYHHVSTFLGQEYVPGYSIGRSIIVLGYFVIVLYATIYKDSPFSNPQRAGFVAMSQVPIVFALGTKNNIFGMILSLGYEKLNWLHRAVGRLVALAANVHALGYFYKWSIQGNFQKNFTAPANVYGFVALLGVDLIVFFSTSFWRRKAYSLFVFSHVAGFILLPVGLALHKPVARPYVFAAVGAYALDHILRLCKTRITQATVRAIPELGMTRVEIPHINAGWRAGQHVRIRVLSSGMGIFGRTESHPFSVASVGGDGMTLMCKKAGNWTNALYDIAARGDTGYSGSDKERATGRRVKVVLEGPYGGPGNTMFDSYSGAMFIAGGSGISYVLSAVQDLIQKDVTGRSRVKVIELVWCIQDAGALMPMLPTFSALIQQATFTSLRISVHYTRATASAVDPNKMYGYLPPNVKITPGRPRLSNILDSVVERSCKLFGASGRVARVSDKLTGVVVAVCGPGGLGDEARKAVGAVDPRRFKAVGGVELCEEIFGW